MPESARLINDAVRMVERADENGIVIKLLGGVAVALLCQNVHSKFPILKRAPHDIDFIGYSRSSRDISRLFVSEFHLRPDQRFNALFGNLRLKFYDERDETNPMVVDVFLDKFKQSHELPLIHRLSRIGMTISPTDLLFTKLQIWEINNKDIIDILSLLSKYQLSDKESNDCIEVHRAEELVGSDWGLWKTSITNIERTEKFLRENKEFSSISPSLSLMLSQLKSVHLNCRKSMSWKIRSVIGERVQWYELPEEV
jgi:hypothetical protein